MLTGVKTEHHEIVSLPTRAHRVVPQNGFLLKTQPLEEVQRPGLIRCHARDHFRHALLQSHLKDQLQQELAQTNPTRCSRHDTRSSATCRAQRTVPRSNVA